MAELDNCPHCGADLLGPPIPTESQALHGGATHFRREIGVEIPGVYDGVLYWACPDCGKAWQRWPAEHPLFKIAQPYIDRANGEPNDLLGPIMAYLNEHPFTGEPQPSGVATFSRNSDTGLVAILSKAPELLDISVEILEPLSNLDPEVVTFTDGVLTLHVEPATLRYRPLRLHEWRRTVQFERIVDEEPTS